MKKQDIDPLDRTIDFSDATKISEKDVVRYRKAARPVTVNINMDTLDYFQLIAEESGVSLEKAMSRILTAMAIKNSEKEKADA